MKKLSDIFDRYDTPTNKGDYVFFNRYPDNFGSNSRSKPKKILGKIKRIDGAYISVVNVLNKKDISELYSVEITKATIEEATLWMFEN